MPSCAFRKCTNNSRNTNKASGVTFHSFPRESHCKEKWIEIIQNDLKDEEWLPTQFSRICSAHFKESDFYLTTGGLRRIKACALPSFNPEEEPLEEEGEENRRPYTPLEDVYVSDTESIFDSPHEISLKRQLRNEKSQREKCRKLVIKLKRQNKCLKSKITQLQEQIKTLKQNK